MVQQPCLPRPAQLLCSCTSSGFTSVPSLLSRLHCPIASELSKKGENVIISFPTRGKKQSRGATHCLSLQHAEEFMNEKECLTALWGNCFVVHAENNSVKTSVINNHIKSNKHIMGKVIRE